MKSILAFGVVALAITACGDNGSAAPAPATEAVATSPSPTTVVVPAPTTTGPIPTTTLSPTTTTVATEDLIKQAVQDYATAYYDCGIDPANCVPARFTSTQGPSRAIIDEFAHGLVAEGLRFSIDPRGSYVVAESVELNSSSTATAIYCNYDAGMVMGPTGPDGQPTIVNDIVASIRYEYSLFLEDGVWAVGRQHEIERLGEGDLCPHVG